MTVACANTFIAKVETNIHNKSALKPLVWNTSQTTFGNLSTRHLLGTEGNRKLAFSLFNLSSHYQIYIAECLLLNFNLT